MKRIALLSFIIGLLAVPIQAQAADPSAEQRLFLERQEEVAKVASNIAAMRHQMMKSVLENLPREPAEEQRLFLERQEEVAKVLSNIADMRHRMMKLVSENLPREPEQNATPPSQYYPAPPAQRATSATDAQTEAIIELQRRMRNAEQLRGFNARFYGGRY